MPTHLEQLAARTATPLHPAFSAYLFNARGEILLTRRALSKVTWPGVWTNSCGGHPKPGETLENAARRRIGEELGLELDGPLVPLLPDFRNRVTDASGVVEIQFCPVYAGFVTRDTPTPDPTEVAEWAWVPWTSLITAITVTPQVFSPWIAAQIPVILARHPKDLPSALPHLASGAAASRPLNADRAVADVDALLSAEMKALTREWNALTGDLGTDVLPQDLPQWLERLLVGRGKRLRVRMAYWGFLTAGGEHDTADYHHLIRVTAALETLHLFALVHDDVMDESDSRRGHRSAHYEAAAWHRDAGAAGEPELFGQNLAILLGDLAHTVADRLVADLPEPLREIWFALSIELMAGQRADLTGAAAVRRDRRHAEHVALLKSGRYTVMRPLHLGAAAAAATPEVTSALLACGDHLGYAFALRDDYLGLWGDPEVTGKPAGDDLYEAKATVLLSLARDRLAGHPARVLARVGSPDLRREDVPALAAAIRAAGVDVEIERIISSEFDAAMDCLAKHDLPPDAVAGLRATAHDAVWRQA